jgi:hypothetical protein
MKLGETYHATFNMEKDDGFKLYRFIIDEQ